MLNLYSISKNIHPIRYISVLQETPLRDSCNLLYNNSVKLKNIINHNICFFESLRDKSNSRKRDMNFITLVNSDHYTLQRFTNLFANIRIG